MDFLDDFVSVADALDGLNGGTVFSQFSPQSRDGAVDRSAGPKVFCERRLFVFLGLAS